MRSDVNVLFLYISGHSKVSDFAHFILSNQHIPCSKVTMDYLKTCRQKNVNLLLIIKPLRKHLALLLSLIKPGKFPERLWRLLVIISFVNNNTSWVNPEQSHINLRFELFQQTAGSQFQKRMQITFFMERYSIPSLTSQANFKSCFEVSVERGLTEGSL